MEPDQVVNHTTESVRAIRTRDWRDPPNLKNTPKADAQRLAGRHVGRRTVRSVVAAVVCRATGCGRLHVREDGVRANGTQLNPLRVTVCGMCWAEDVDADPDDVRGRMCRDCANSLGCGELT